MDTTVGTILLNDMLPQDLRDYHKPLDKKGLMELLGKIGHQYPNQYADLVKKIKDFGDHTAFIEGSSYSLHDFKPAVLTELDKKYDPLYKKALAIKDRKQQEEQIKQINTLYEQDVNEKVKVEKENPTGFNKWIFSGARGSADDLRQIRYSVGNMVDVRNKVYPHSAKNSFSQGLKPSEFFIASLGARKGIVGSFISVRDPGAFGKELYTLTNDMIITMLDCNTQNGKMYDIDNPGALDRYLLKPVGPYHRNDLVTTDMRKVLRQKNITSIWVRSPLDCQAKEGICAKCFGLLEDGHEPHVGDTVGLRSAQSMTEKLTQMALSDKHTGGVVKKKTPFDTIKQLAHIPENFPGGAVLARVSGKINKITKSPDGGTTVFIGSTEHYLTPQQKLIVKIGQALQPGEQISDGIANPAEVVKYQGLRSGRQYWAESVQKVYEDSGINGHPKVFETVSRAVLNHGEVTNPGDHDLTHGEIVRWNQHQDLTEKTIYLKNPLECAGWRLAEKIPGVNIQPGRLLTDVDIKTLARVHPTPVKVYRNPATITPIVKGTERGALHKDDWQSNLGFRFLKGTLAENVALGAKSNIHSFDPVPAYVYGAEFGKGEGGRF